MIIIMFVIGLMSAISLDQVVCVCGVHQARHLSVTVLVTSPQAPQAGSFARRGSEAQQHTADRKTSKEFEKMDRSI